MTAASSATIAFTDSQGNTTNTSTPSFTSVGIGTAAADRYVLVGSFGSKASGTGLSVTNLKIATVTATEVIIGGTDSGAHQFGFHILNVTSGTTATIDITYDATVQSSAIIVWELNGLTGAGAAHATDTDTDESGNPTGSLNVPAAGVCAGVGYSNGNTTMSWSGITEVADFVTESNRAFSGASDAFASAQSPLASVCTIVTPSKQGGAWVSFA